MKDLDNGPDNGEPGRGAFSFARDVTGRTCAQEQLRTLARRVVDAQEEERRRLARELHDDLCQWLSGMKLSLNMLEEKVARKSPLRRTLRSLKRQINQRIAEVRRTAVHLRPAALDDLGLSIALSRLCDDYRRLHAIEIRFHTSGPLANHYHPEVDTNLYRICQEALSNIAKHSRARRASIHLAQCGLMLTLAVEDDGIGMPQNDVRKTKSPGDHLGLISMRERAMLLGGTFRISSAHRQGTCIHVTLPLDLYHNEEDQDHLRR